MIEKGVMRVKFVFLILHYKNDDVTKQCIESLIQCFGTLQMEIIVVDNASDNGSYEKLLQCYGNASYIHFLHNRKNLGYAAGNNVGFQYAKKVLKADWICLANNDVIFQDEKWIDKVRGLYHNTPYYVLGPDIVTPQGQHQNPFREHVASNASVLKNWLHDIVVYLALKLKLQRKINQDVKPQKELKKETWKQTNLDFHGVLHGSCLLFSPDYVRSFDGLYGGTFLYCEEEILCYILEKVGYRYVYCSDVQVLHNHSTFFKRSVQNEIERKKIIVKNRIQSYYKFLKITRYRGDIREFLKERGE